MRPKYRLVVILLFVLSRGYAQQTPLQGTVTDAHTGKPIAGATISIPAKNFFFPADDEGKYDITDNSVASIDTISISAIGYITLRLPVNGLARPAISKLTPYITLLNEVKIGAKPSVIVTVG